MPCSPLSPFKPCIPWIPCSPLSPLSPFAPFKIFAVVVPLISLTVKVAPVAVSYGYAEAGELEAEEPASIARTVEELKEYLLK